ncbi:hypothetical protein [Halorarius litoreus]|uniref:hypothetical protein n=1 Tax=Halorarius litoreus TaxID=2962676 RepID=UPI0020CC8034|nr:hypothetical protein [Halorarius litoreus]
MPQQPVAGPLVDWRGVVLLVVGSLFVGGLAAVTVGQATGGHAMLGGVVGSILAFVALVVLLFGR